MSLTAILADRVRRLVPMLSSSHDGEVIATRNAIGRELVAGGRDWHDLAAAIHSDARPSAPPPVDAPYAFGDLARACRDMDRGRLSYRERAFVADMCRRGFFYEPSARQTSWLRDIYNRLAGRAAA